MKSNLLNRCKYQGIKWLERFLFLTLGFVICKYDLWKIALVIVKDAAAFGGVL